MSKEKRLLKIEQAPSEGVRSLLDNNLIGTPGKSMVYQHGQAAEKYQAIPDPYFVSLVRKTKVLATCCFCRRSINDQGIRVEAFYVRYFSFHPSIRRMGEKARLKEQSDGELRQEIQQLLSGEYFDTAGPHFYYAYIDGGNVRSEAFVRSFGFEKIGSFVSLVFSRFYPRQSQHVQRMTPEEWEAFKSVLLHFYKDHTLVTDENLFYQHNYFVIREKGEVVAALQANPERWMVHDMPGPAGKVMMKVFPRFKFLSKIFHPNYRFATIEGIYYKPGHEQKLVKLLEHALHTHAVYSAVICLDPTSRIYRVVQSLGLGLVSKLRHPKAVDVMVMSQGLAFSGKEGPVYVSAVDVS